MENREPGSADTNARGARPAAGQRGADSPRGIPRFGVGLLGTRRFGPYFLTQFLGAFNDYFFLGALLGLGAAGITSVGAGSFDDAGPSIPVAGLFLLPFFLCSAVAGQLADGYDKARLIRRVELAAIPIATLAAAAVLSANPPLMLVAALSMGAQSAFFGPAKYAILPAHLRHDELTGGNALVQSGMLAAIVFGTAAGGSLVTVPGGGRAYVAIAVVAVAVLGWIASRRIPAAAPISVSRGVDVNVFRSTWQALRCATASRTVLLSVLGIAWFWFLVSVLLTHLPAFARDVLGAGRGVATLLLATFAIGVAAGALLCERCSGRRVEVGLVPMGALGMAAFAASFALADVSPALRGGPGVASLLSAWEGFWLVARIFLLAMSAGLYVVPLYALVQARSDSSELSRVVAANNFANASFVVLAAAISALLLRYGLSAQQAILVVAAIHVGVAAFIFFEVPEFAMRLVVWLITHSIYRVSAAGVDHVPARGPAVLVANHVSLFDPLIITAKCRRPIRFVMYYKIYRIPFVNFLFRASGAIPIASQREDPALLDRAYDEIAATLERGGLVGIFPEGRLTETGELGDFRTGIERILDRTPVPVVPMALSGLWGTFFTRYDGRPLMSRWPRHWLARIRLNVGPPIAPTEVSAAALAAKVRSLLVPF